MKKQKIELLSPAGSMAKLKAVIFKGADAVYLGMNRFSARDFSTNFNKEQLKEAIILCKSNNVKVYLAMNTLVKNDELREYFNQLSYAYSKGIDAVIIQEISFIDIIKRNFPGLGVHISTQGAVMNSAHAQLLNNADRIVLARELKAQEIRTIRKNFKGEIEIFCHGALCISLSGQCLFSSLLGGRSGNRGKCAQPCRKIYNDEYYLSSKELCLIGEIPQIIDLGVDSIKIEGRMRTPYYAASVTESYRTAIDSFYAGKFNVSESIKEKLARAFSRGFTKGCFAGENVFNRERACGESSPDKLEHYTVSSKKIKIERKPVVVKLPRAEKKSGKKALLVRVYNEGDALLACENGADIVYLDLFHEKFKEIKKEIKCKLYAATPGLMFDSDIPKINEAIGANKPDGLLAGNLGVLNMGLKLPIHLNYNLNFFNEFDTGRFPNCLPVISPELSMRELKFFNNKNFACLVHGKIRLMTLRHDLSSVNSLKDELGINFPVRKIHNGFEILNEKELGLLGKSSALIKSGINCFFIDTENNVGEITAFYRASLDGIKAGDRRLKKDYVLGWSFMGVK